MELDEETLRQILSNQAKVRPWFEYWPDMDQPDYDGVHCGFKGLREDAPEEIKELYKKTPWFTI